MSYFTNPALSASIVLYKAGLEATRTVKSFDESDVPLQLFVVDNSPGGTLHHRLEWQCPGIQYRPQKKNVGYGRGNNAVLPELSSKYHVICNPDVTFDPDLLGRMMDYMETHPDCAILTPRVKNPDGTEQHLPKLTPTVRYLLGGFFEDVPGPFKRWRTEYTMRDKEIHVPVHVDFATGCFMLIRTGVLHQLKGFDERFFLYHEDSDLSRRALRIGSIIYHPDFVVTHHWKRASKGDLLNTLRHIRSTIQYFNKWGWKW